MNIDWEKKEQQLSTLKKALLSDNFDKACLLREISTLKQSKMSVKTSLVKLITSLSKDDADTIQYYIDTKALYSEDTSIQDIGFFNNRFRRIVETMSNTMIQVVSRIESSLVEVKTLTKEILEKESAVKRLKRNIIAYQKEISEVNLFVSVIPIDTDKRHCVDGIRIAIVNVFYLNTLDKEITNTVTYHVYKTNDGRILGSHSSELINSKTLPIHIREQVQDLITNAYLTTYN